jgi:hypothetical protein
MNSRKDYCFGFARIAFMISIITASILGIAGISFSAPDDAPYYGPKTKVDLEGRAFNFVTTDKRNLFSKIDCSDCAPVHTTEFAEDPGFAFFKDYLKKMIEASSASIDPTSENMIEIELEALSPRIFGFVFRRVHGLTQFTVKSKTFTKRYCADVKDGDPDSPLSMTSVSTKSGAMRAMVSASTSKTIELFLKDLQMSLSGQPKGIDQAKESKRQQAIGSVGAQGGEVGQAVANK